MKKILITTIALLSINFTHYGYAGGGICDPYDGPSCKCDDGSLGSVTCVEKNAKISGSNQHGPCQCQCSKNNTKCSSTFWK